VGGVAVFGVDVTCSDNVTTNMASARFHYTLLRRGMQISCNKVNGITHIFCSRRCPMSSAKLHLNSVKSLDLHTLMQWRSQGVARVTKATRNPLYEKNIIQKQLILFATFTLHIKLHPEPQWRRNTLNVL